jgi:hypothetical protein
MMKEIAIGLAGLAVAGLATVAYRHPEDFRKIYIWLMAGLGGVCTFIIGHAVGLYKAHDAGLPFVKDDQLMAYGAALRAADFDFQSTVLGLAGSGAYLVFLAFLPYIINLKGRDRRD